MIPTLLLVITSFLNPINCDLVFNYDLYPADCNNGASITLNFSGGCPPYSIFFQDSLLEKTEVVHQILISDLQQGNYHLQVIDGKSCSIEHNIEVVPPRGIQVTAISTAASSNNNGSIQLEVEGSPPYKINWQDNSKSRNRQYLAPGKYYATITDDAGCSTTTSVVVAEEKIIEPKENENKIASQQYDYEVEAGKIPDYKKEKRATSRKKTSKKTSRQTFWKKIFKKRWKRARKPRKPKIRRSSRYSECFMF